MSGRTAVFLLLALTMLLIALSTGAAIYYLVFGMLLCMAALSFLCLLIALLLMQVQVTLPQKQVIRGDNLSMRVHLRRRCPLPVGQVDLLVSSSCADQAASWMRTNLPSLRGREYRYLVTCPHRGQYQVGISQVRLTDVFGLFSLSRRLKSGYRSIEVIPRVSHEHRSIDIIPGETGPQSRIRMTEDTSSPAGVRSWQDGDELKKVHWKLSMRKRELMVRTYEESARPDTLVLMDLSPVNAAASQIATIEDHLCEAAGSAVFAQLRDGYPVRMPLNNTHPTELAGQFTAQFENILNHLSRVQFDCPYPFEHVLSLEMRRMQRTGGVLMITSRLNSQIADYALRLRHMDMHVHLIWVASSTHSDANDWFAQLQMQGVTTEFISIWNS